MQMRGPDTPTTQDETRKISSKMAKLLLAINKRIMTIAQETALQNTSSKLANK